jgi:MFS superfamily sulfate permease-like transporter
MVVQIGAGHGAQVGLITNSVVMIGVNAKGSSRQLFVEQKAGIVFIHFALGENNGALSLNGRF